MSAPAATKRDEFFVQIAELFRELVVEASITPELPVLADVEAERELLSATLKGIIPRTFAALEGKHFYLAAHQKLWDYAGRLSWETIRTLLCGEDVRLFYECLAEREPQPPEALKELAERVIELYEARTLVGMFRRIEGELRLGTIQVCDAEEELAKHMQRGLTCAW